MKLRNLHTAFATLAILAGIGSAQTGVIGTPPPITFDTRAFNRTMRTALDGKGSGYQYVLIKKGQVVAQRAAGLAQNAADGNVPMTLDTPTNMGSLGKFFSGTAMLGLMQKPQTNAQFDQGLSLDMKLDRPIWTLMPNAWLTGMKPGIENITIRQMLQHRTGFDTGKAGNRSVLAYLKEPNGFLPLQYDVREYANINYVLNGYLLAAYSDPSVVQFWNNSQNLYGWNDFQVDALFRQTMGTGMHNLMKSRIWDKMTPKISPNCDATNTLQNVAAYGYNSVNDATTGQIVSSIDSQGHCGGHGGYFLSARALANYVAHAMETDLIINQEARDLMHTDDMAPADRLVWSFNRPSVYFGQNFNMPNIPYSNGVTGGWRSIIVKFPQDYYLVVATNSPEVDSNEMIQLCLQGFRDATEHNFD